MTLSEWTPSVRAVSNTPVTDCSAHGIDTVRRIAYRPPLTVSAILLAPSVYNFDQTSWRYCQLRLYIGMGSLGTRLHQNSNAMGDAVKISPRIHSTCAQNAILSLLSIHITASRKIYMAIGNPSLVLSICCLSTSSYLWNYVCVADDVSHGENFQSNGCQCFSHWYKFRHRMHVTWLFEYCGESQS